MIGKILPFFLFFIGIVFANFYPGECFIFDSKEFCIPHDASAGNYTFNYTIEVYVEKEYYLIPAPYENESKINYFSNETNKLIRELLEKDKKIDELKQKIIEKENRINELEKIMNETNKTKEKEVIEIEKIIEKENFNIISILILLILILSIIIIWIAKKL